MVKVLFISHTSNLYGAERSLLDLSIKLNQCGTILPIFLVPGNGPLCDRLQEHNIQFIRTRYFHWIGKNQKNRVLLGGLRFLINLLLLPKLLHIIQREKIQVIYTNTLSTPFGAMLAIASNRPHIWHIREFVHEDMGRDFDFGVRLAGLLIRQSNLIICNSNAVLKKWRSYLPNGNMEVVYNGFEFPDEKPPPSDRSPLSNQAAPPEEQRCALLMVGSVYPHKGHRDAVKALKTLRESGINAELTIVGDGDPAFIKSLQHLSKKLGLFEHIKWTGYVHHVHDYYRNHAMLLVCSKCEAFGRVAVEAIVSGIPAIVTERGGLTEIVDNGKWGLTYEHGNVAMLTMQIKKILLDYPIFKANLIEGSRTLKRRYSMSNYTGRIGELIVRTSVQTPAHRHHRPQAPGTDGGTL